MGWLARRRARRLAELRTLLTSTHKDQMPTMIEALFKALGQFAQTQVDFAKGLADINVKRSAALIGQRGGIRTQARAKAKRLTATCPWCMGENTNQAFDWHRANHHSAETLEVHRNGSMPNAEGN